MRTGGCQCQQRSGYYRCCKCSIFADCNDCQNYTVKYLRCDSIKKAWSTVCDEVKVEDLRFHDLKRFFNKSIPQELLGFSVHESGWYTGNSSAVNLEHYSPITTEYTTHKIGKTDLGGISLLNWFLSEKVFFTIWAVIER